jgi:hypothetical protein
VRRVGDAQSWLVSGSLTLPRTAADWLKKDIVDVPAKDVTDVTITRADGRGVHLHKDTAGDANFKLVDIPKGREAGSPYAVNAPASALADLNLEDVSQASDAAPGNDALKVRYLTFDGIVIDVTAWKKDDKNYADFNASLDAAQADQGIAADQAKAKADYEAASAKPDAAKDAKTVDAVVKPLAVSDPASDHANRLAAVNKKIADLDAHFKGWTFALPPYKYASFDKSIDDVLKPLEPKKPAAIPAKEQPAKAAKPKR